MMVWSPKLQFKVWGRSDQWLLRYSNFRILRSSSIGIHLHYEQLSILVLSSKLKFKIWGWSVQSLLRYKFELRSHQQVLRYSIFNILRSSSIGGHLHYEQLSILVLSSKLKFKIWGWLVQSLLRYKFLFGMSRKGDGWLAGKCGGGSAKKCILVKIMPLCGPSCKLRLARFSAKLKLQDRAECGKISQIVNENHSEQWIKGLPFLSLLCLSNNFSVTFPLYNAVSVC